MSFFATLLFIYISYSKEEDIFISTTTWLLSNIWTIFREICVSFKINKGYIEFSYPQGRFVWILKIYKICLISIILREDLCNVLFVILLPSFEGLKLILVGFNMYICYIVILSSIDELCWWFNFGTYMISYLNNIFC